MTPISDDMVERAIKMQGSILESAPPRAAMKMILTAALEGSVAVPVEMTDGDLNLILGRSVTCSPTPMTAMFRNFHAAVVKHYSAATTRQERGTGS